MADIPIVQTATTSRAVLTCGALVLSCAILHAQSAAPDKRKLGPQVNTDEYREIGPLVSADGTTLYFLREDQGQELVRSMNAQANAAMDDLKASLASLDPATRAQMEAVLGDMGAKPATAPTLNLVHQVIWISRRGSDGQWGPATKMPPPLSDDVGTIWAGSVLPDNNTLLVGGQIAGGLLERLQDTARQTGSGSAESGFFDALIAARDGASGAPGTSSAGTSSAGTSSDDTAGTTSDRSTVFAWSTRTATGWSAPAPIRMRGFEHNAPRLEIVQAPDGRHLLLAIRNRESNGEHDLYVSTLGDDGVWSKPVNLGALVNSPGRECSPSMAPDNRTLYFCSDRPGGLGGFDYYLTRRLDESWQRWSPVENMGPEVNSAADDISLTVDASGKLAFMAIGPLMHEDIYEFTLPPSLRPKPVAFVWGRVTTPDGAPLPAGIAYEILRSGEGAGQANAKPGDGSYQIALPIGEDYAFRAAAAGYVAVSDRIDLAAVAEGERLERNLVLVPLEVGTAIRLNNVFFDTAKTALLPESRRELDRLVALMRDLPSLRIEIRGHTDALDDDAFNLTLSEGRASAVAGYLVNAGVTRDRLQSRGFGERMAIGSNATDEGRKLNRRVEFVVLSR